MNPDYESEGDTKEFHNKKQGGYMKPRYSGLSDKGGKSSSHQKRTESSNGNCSRAWKNSSTCEQTKNISNTCYPDKEECSNKALGIVGMVKDAFGSSSLERQKNDIDCSGAAIGNWNNQAAVNSASFSETPSANDGETDKLWHYRDPNGNVQGPFSMVQLQKWSTTGYFPPDMRIWATRQDDSILLTDALEGQFCNYDVRRCENMNATERVGNQIVSYHERGDEVERLNSCPNPGNHENKSNSHGFSGLSSGQNWRAQPVVDHCSNNLNSNPSVACVTKSNDLIKQNGVVDIPNLHLDKLDGQVAENKQPVSSVVPVRDSDLLDLRDLPSSTPKKSNEDEEAQDAGDKQSVPSKFVVQDSGPSWSSASSLVVGGGAQLREIADEWGGYSPTPVKPSVEEWDSGLASVSSLKPLETMGDCVATPTSNIDQVIHSSPSQPAASNVTLQAVETIEFSTLAEESVSDLLAEVDAMESQSGLGSPTSNRNNYGGDFIHGGSIEEFSPIPDQGTRSDGFSSTGGDIYLPCHSTTTDELVGASQVTNVFDFVKRTSFQSSISPEADGETKSTDTVDHKDMIRSEDMVAKSADFPGKYHGSDLQPPPPLSNSQDIVDVDNAGPTRAEVEGETKSSDVQVEEEEDGEYIPPDLVDPSSGSEVVGRVTIDHGRAGGGTVQQHGEAKTSDVPVERVEDGEYIQHVPPLTMNLHLVDSKIVRRAGTEVMDSVWDRSTIDHGRAGDGVVQQSSTRAEVEEEDGEYIQPAAPLTLNLDMVDLNVGQRAQSEVADNGWGTMQGNVNLGWGRRSAQEIMNTALGNANMNCNSVGSESQRRYGGERFNGPKDRGYPGQDLGSSRGRSSWSRHQSSTGGGGGGGGGYSRPPPKGQRVCKFYESGRCKKGALCNYLHP